MTSKAFGPLVEIAEMILLQIVKFEYDVTINQGFLYHGKYLTKLNYCYLFEMKKDRAWISQKISNLSSSFLLFEESKFE